MTFSQIPVIDAGGLRSPHLSNRQAVATNIRQASHEVGFFYIANHGIPEEAIAATFTQVKRFFDPNNQALVECLPTCHGAGNLPKYMPITAGEHIVEMYRQTYQLTAATA